MSLMLAIQVQSFKLSSDFSQTFAGRRRLPSHAKMCSGTHRRGRFSSLLIEVVEVLERESWPSIQPFTSVDLGPEGDRLIPADAAK